MTTGRRVLTVLPDFPLPATTGLHLRMTGNLDAVARTSQRSDVLWFSTADRTFDTVDVARLLLHCDGAEHAVQRIEQHELGTAALVSSKFRFAITGALGLRSRVYPYSMRYDAVDAASRIAVAVATTGADVVVLPSQGMHWMHHLPSHVDVIIDAADVLTDVTARLAGTGKGVVHRLGLWANHLACRAQERRFLPQAAEVWTTSAAEAERFEQIAPGVRTVVVPNTVPEAPSSTRSAGPVSTRAFGMLATWSYRPNLDALDRLLDGVLPRLLGKGAPNGADVRLVIAGRDLPTEYQRRCEQSPVIDVLGAVDDLDEFYRRVDLVALPIDVRGGVPLKLAEAMARGVPVVASPALVAGLDLADGVDVAVAGDDAAMADAITRVFDDEAFRDGLVANARRAHRRLFSADAVDGALRAGSILCSP